MNDPMPLDESTCDEVEALLPLVVDGAVAAEDDPQLFAHLARCPACQDSLALYDLAELALARRAPEVATTESVVIRRVAWPVAIGGGVLAAAAALSAWIALTGDQPAPTPAAEQADKRVIAVREAPDGSRSFVIERNGEIIEVDAVDGSDHFDGDHREALPVLTPSRGGGAVRPVPIH